MDLSKLKKKKRVFGMVAQLCALVVTSKETINPAAICTSAYYNIRPLYTIYSYFLLVVPEDNRSYLLKQGDSPCILGSLG